MAIPPDELLGALEAALNYPIATASVVDRLGGEEIEAPDRSDSLTVAEVLAPVGEETFDSPEALFEGLLSNLSDDYVGRKFYDDRGTNVRETDDAGPRDERDESF